MRFKLSCLLISFIPYVSNAVDNIYINLETGLSVNKKLGSEDYTTKPDNSQTFGIGIGKRISKDLELELAYYHNTFNFNETNSDISYNQKFAINTIFINANMHFIKHKKFTHYLTMGIGRSHNEAGDYKATGTVNGIRLGKAKAHTVFNIGSGIRTKLTDRMDISLTYKYFDLGNAETSMVGVVGFFAATDSPIVAKLNNHAIIIGITYYL